MVVCTFLLKGMDEVGLQCFLGRCESNVLESIFPMLDDMFIWFDDLKEIMVFEETKGHEEMIHYWHNYLAHCQNMNLVSIFNMLH